MRLIFAGTPEFAERSLRALLDAGHDVALVLTQPDRPSGRGLRSTPSAVKRLAVERRLAVDTPATLADQATQARLLGVSADFLVVAAYGLIIPASLLEHARFGAVNIHASLLPRWRGAAPIQRALMAGDHQTGITLMRMDAGLDTGPMLVQSSIEIAADDDAGTLHDRLAELGARMIVESLPAIASGQLRPSPQPADGVTYARKIAKPDLALDWRRSATEIERTIRALRPAPGATARMRGESVKVWRADVSDASGEVGQVLAADDRGILVACGEGALRITELQRAGGRRLVAAEFLRGFAVNRGERLE
ncbi:MAG TPA: methionyl-tRNA formyltransferase [Burkholderiales bacterium]|nr:methionyl-tRNA formyltransferase [Burkholderiales bacterium]